MNMSGVCKDPLPGSFSALPDELIVQILLHAGAQATIACQLASRRIRLIYLDSLPLRYAVELAASGLRDGPQPGRTVAERFLILEKHRGAWLSGERSTPDVPLPQTDWKGNRIVSGGLIITYGDEPNELLLYQMSSPLRGIEARKWKLTLDYDPGWICVDAMQDLLIAGKGPGPEDTEMGKFSVRTLSTGDFHELAPLHRDSLARPPSRRDWRSEDHLDIHGCYFAWSTYLPHETRTIVWNWQTGALVLDAVEKGARERHSFKFLDENHAIMQYRCHLRNDEVTLQIFVYTLNYEAGRTSNSITCTHLLSLPDNLGKDKAHKFRGASVEFHHDSMKPPLQTSSTELRGYFHPDPQEWLLGVFVWGTHDVIGDTFSGVHIRTRALMSYIVATQSDGNPINVHWEKWSPNVARFHHFPSDKHYPPDVPFTIADMRFVVPELTFRGGKFLATVFDYHPRRVQHARAGQPRGAAGVSNYELDLLVYEIPVPEDAHQEIEHTGLRLCGDALNVYHRYRLDNDFILVI
ncbi:hypothetical protein BC834DRAFT_389730 [Gloeopeniophorella convolvens]|nr:hypothetical protein BC834DRAFT_389730 [Gloeopeniophorella convolvens]